MELWHLVVKPRGIDNKVPHLHATQSEPLHYNLSINHLYFTKILTESSTVSAAASNDLSEANANESLSGVVSPNIALLTVYEQSTIEPSIKEQAKGKHKKIKD